MPIFQPNKKNILKDFQSEVDKMVKTFTTPMEMFEKIRPLFTRLELMIIDSGCKRMPLDSLHNTLLLKHTTYLDVLQSATKKLKNL